MAFSHTTWHKLPFSVTFYFYCNSPGTGMLILICMLLLCKCPWQGSPLLPVFSRIACNLLEHHSVFLFFRLMELSISLRSSFFFSSSFSRSCMVFLTLQVFFFRTKYNLLQLFSKLICCWIGRTWDHFGFLEIVDRRKPTWKVTCGSGQVTSLNTHPCS